MAAKEKIGCQAHNGVKCFIKKHSYFYAPIFSREISIYVYNIMIQYHDFANIDEVLCENAAA